MQTEMSPEQIETEKVYRDMGLTDEEYERMKDILKRRPNYTETGIFSVMWSEHCSYKTSTPLLKQFPTEAPHVLQGPGEGAGVIDIGDQQAVVFKMESHNSPSAVEPYEGAATGVGGIVRDIFSMGARPIAAMNSLRFGNLENERTKYLFKEVIHGMSDYGNRLGVPTVGGEVQFDSSYEDRPLVNAMVIGLLDHEDMQKGIAAGAGNSVIYAGASTGRDGIHGATFSSDEVGGGSLKENPTVQAGDPFTEKQLIEACLEAIESDALIGIQDMGAAGLTSSASEMASKAGMGMELNLDFVPQRDENLSAYEMMLSESQERMLLVVEKGREQEIIDVFHRYHLEAVQIGTVIEEKSFRIQHEGELKSDVPVDALTEDVPVRNMPAQEAVYYQTFQQMNVDIPDITNYAETLEKLLAQPTIASKEWAYSQFDSKAQIRAVVGPGAGAAVVRIKGKDKSIAISADCNSRYVYLDPETGGKIAVAEAARNVVCSGARPLALTDGLNYGNPEDPEVFWQMKMSTAGMSAASKALSTPVISGNVSLYNQSKGKSIYPTPIVGMVGVHESLDHITPNYFQDQGDVIFLIGETEAEFGGSELQNIMDGEYKGKAPDLNLDVEAKRQMQLLEAIQAGVVRSATDLSEGGLAVALSESVFHAQGVGFDVQLQGDATTALFSETQSRFLVTVKQDQKDAFASMIEDAKEIGVVTADALMNIQINGKSVIEASVEQMERKWKGAIPCLLNSEA